LDLNSFGTGGMLTLSVAGRAENLTVLPICGRESGGAGYQGDSMIEKVVKKRDLNGFSEVKENLAYWLARTPTERVEAVEYLRRQAHGSAERLQRVARVVESARR